MWAGISAACSGVRNTRAREQGSGCAWYSPGSRRWHDDDSRTAAPAGCPLHDRRPTAIGGCYSSPPPGTPLPVIERRLAIAEHRRYWKSAPRALLELRAAPSAISSGLREELAARQRERLRSDVHALVADAHAAGGGRLPAVRGRARHPGRGAQPTVGTVQLTSPTSVEPRPGRSKSKACTFSSEPSCHGRRHRASRRSSRRTPAPRACRSRRRPRSASRSSRARAPRSPAGCACRR